MLNIGIGELIVLVALVLIVVGPERLPQMMRSMGRMYGKVRRQSDELRRAFMAEADLIDASERRVALKERQRQIKEAKQQKQREAAEQEDSSTQENVPAADVSPTSCEGDTEAAEQALAAIAARALPEGVVPREPSTPKEPTSE